MHGKRFYMKSTKKNILKELIERIDEGVFVLNHAFECLEVNTTALQILSIREKEAKTSVFTDYLNTIHASNFMQAVKDAKKYEKEISFNANLGKFEKCSLVKCKVDEDLLFVYIKEIDPEICIQLNSKNTYNLHSIKEDCTHFKKLGEVINGNPFPTLIVSQTNEIILVNKEFEHVFKYTNAQLHKVEIRKLFLKEEEALDAAHQPKIMPNYWSARNDLKLQRANGSFVPVDVKVNSFIENDELLYIFVIRDIRKIKAFQRKINSQDQKLKDIAWIHSHLMRQPLTNILALINTVEACDNLEDKMECISMLKECSYQFDNLIKKAFEKTGHKSIFT